MLDPWISQLSTQLLEVFPLPLGVELLPETIPAPRVSIVDSPDLSSLSLSGTKADDGYRTVTLTKNERITAEDWYQDVRHFDFDFDEDIQYVFTKPMHNSV